MLGILITQVVIAFYLGQIVSTGKDGDFTFKTLVSMSNGNSLRVITDGAHPLDIRTVNELMGRRLKASRSTNVPLGEIILLSYRYL
jgi:hypothetical protein